MNIRAVLIWSNKKDYTNNNRICSTPGISHQGLSEKETDPTQQTELYNASLHSSEQKILYKNNKVEMEKISNFRAINSTRKKKVTNFSEENERNRDHFRLPSLYWLPRTPTEGQVYCPANQDAAQIPPKKFNSIKQKQYQTEIKNRWMRNKWNSRSSKQWRSIAKAAENKTEKKKSGMSELLGDRKIKGKVKENLRKTKKKPDGKLDGSQRNGLRRAEPAFWKPSSSSG